MYALTPFARKKQQLFFHLHNKETRQTRQIDSKRRQTFNSRDEKLLNIDQDVTIKKKQKIHQSNGDSKSEMHLSENENEDNNSIGDSNIADKENSAKSTNFSTSDDEGHTLNNVSLKHIQNGTSIGLANQQPMFSTNILGEGHLSILHAYVRDDLFKNIKILSSNHLETKGEIMQECLKLLKYSESRNGNLTAFANACRTEIRKTICSRRGYVKRQTGILINGTSIYYTSILLNNNSF